MTSSTDIPKRNKDTKPSGSRYRSVEDMISGEALSPEVEKAYDEQNQATEVAQKKKSRVSLIIHDLSFAKNHLFVA